MKSFFTFHVFELITSIFDRFILKQIFLIGMLKAKKMWQKLFDLIFFPTNPFTKSRNFNIVLKTLNVDKFLF